MHPNIWRGLSSSAEGALDVAVSCIFLLLRRETNLFLFKSTRTVGSCIFETLNIIKYENHFRPSSSAKRKVSVLVMALSQAHHHPTVGCFALPIIACLSLCLYLSATRAFDSEALFVPGRNGSEHGVWDVLIQGDKAACRAVSLEFHLSIRIETMGGIRWPEFVTGVWSPRGLTGRPAKMESAAEMQNSRFQSPPWVVHGR